MSSGTQPPLSPELGPAQAWGFMEYVSKFLNINRLIGQGAFGKVLSTSLLQNQENQQSRFALKCIHPVLRPPRLASELRHLRDLGGQCNVVYMHTAYFDSGYLYIVMDLIDHDRFVDIVAQLDHEEIVIYMKNLLIALEHVHAHNVMHRDIKPGNFLFNRKNRKFLLVDFGLAQAIKPRAGLFTNNAGSTPTTPNVKLMSLVSPTTPNISQKRTFPQILNTRDFKKLRVSNGDIKEPVKLTVGAFESPVTDHHKPQNTYYDNHHHPSHQNHLNNNISRLNHPRPDRHNLTGRPNNQDAERFSTPKTPIRRQNNSKCDCRGKPKTCAVCSSRPDSAAPRSGTPGFKAPEILLRYQHQTSAVDIWSAGVIFACLLCGHSPFFRDVDDSMSLAEIITLLGTRKVVQAAQDMGIRLLVEPKRSPVDLINFCQNMRSNNPRKNQFDIPRAAFDLLYQMLDPNPNTRITASAALKHPWFAAAADDNNTTTPMTTDCELPPQQ